ncbi:hypothetical protein [Limoniibacter endophyticus]|uniref:hypothetical protein n=1 Tax=Limoniibacter endophyticus TaxID=1565040 RepID=UPI0016784804|nr:hypothetical protein [Limoniibacter endophyticus]
MSARISRELDIVSRNLAFDPEISDADLHRVMGEVERQMMQIQAASAPIPFELVRWRAILARTALQRHRSLQRPR